MCRRSARNSRLSSIAFALYRPCFHRALRLRSKPSGVRGPVLGPPCIRQRPFGIAGLLHGVPALVRAPQRGALSGLPGRLPFFKRPKFRDTWASWAILANSPGPIAPAPTLYGASDYGLSARPDLDALVNNSDRLLATTSDPIERLPAIIVATEGPDSGVGQTGSLDRSRLQLTGRPPAADAHVNLAEQVFRVGGEFHP
jgi:hypothetical protein